MGPSTSWSDIRAAQGIGRGAHAAFGKLIGRYEKSVVALIRRYGQPPDQTPADLKQAFFTRMLERNDIARLDESRGHFRAWLYKAVTRFLQNDWKRWKAEKAGHTVTGPLVSEPVGREDPEHLYFVGYAWETHKLAITRLRAAQRNKRLFDALQRFLPGPEADLDGLAPIAESLDMSRTALGASLCRLRERFWETLREVVAETVDAVGPDAKEATEREVAFIVELLRTSPNPWAS
jgi:DNA-directed RNA polymerase specialized sigma24 family protein